MHYLIRRAPTSGLESRSSEGESSIRAAILNRRHRCSTLAEQEALTAGTEGLAIDAIHMQAIAASSGADSIRLNRTALARAEASADPNARRWRASLRNNLGWDLFDAGDFTAALSEFELALELRRAEGDPIRITHAEEAVAEARKALEAT